MKRSNLSDNKRSLFFFRPHDCFGDGKVYWLCGYSKPGGKPSTSPPRLRLLIGQRQRQHRPTDLQGCEFSTIRPEISPPRVWVPYARTGRMLGFTTRRPLELLVGMRLDGIVKLHGVSPRIGGYATGATIPLSPWGWQVRRGLRTTREEEEEPGLLALRASTRAFAGAFDHVRTQNISTHQQRIPNKQTYLSLFAPT